MDYFVCNQKKVSENDTYFLFELAGEDAEILADDFESLESVFPDYPFDYNKYYTAVERRFTLDEECSEDDAIDFDENGNLVKF